MNRKLVNVEILCHECRTPTTKTLEYLVRRVRECRTKFFCSRSCSNQHHSKTMTGSNNPNYEGVFRGRTMADLSADERAERGRKISKTMLERGSAKGSRNGRWAGGEVTRECVVCRESTSVRPHINRAIQQGLRVPCCSPLCASIYAQSQVKTSRTSIEVKMAQELDRRQLTYQEQYVLGNKFVLDFFLPEYGIVIECDGNYWHTNPDVAKRDRSKNAYVAACGYKMLRFWESEINESIESCVDVVLAEINAAERAA